MEIIKSKYTSNEIKDFVEKESQLVGSENIKKIKRLEGCLNVLFAIACIAIGMIGVYCMLKSETDAMLLTAIVATLVAIICLAAVYMYNRRSESGYYILTEKIMKKRGIPLSMALTDKFEDMAEEHLALRNLAECLEKHPTAAIEQYDGLGSVYVSYRDGFYKKTKKFDFHGDTIKHLIKSDVVDCTYCDKYFEKAMSVRNV